MVKSLRTNTLIVAVHAPSILAWIPLPRILTSRTGVRSSSSGIDAGKNRVMLSASNEHGDDRVDDDSDQPEGEDNDFHSQPLFAEADRLNYLSRLEAIYDFEDTDTDFFTGSTEDKSERVVLGDWMAWEDGACYGDSCGDEFDVSLS